MKRTFAIATASLCLAGAAQAQSSVTLYGIVDLNLSQTKAGSNVGGASLTTMNDGSVNGMNGSRWGLRVNEDLGGGFKAGALLESGVNADTGTSGQGGRLFGRQGFVFLSSNAAGELRLGRQYIAHDIVMGLTNPFGNGMVLNPGIGLTNRGKALPQFIDAPRQDNMVQYQTPVLAGFVGRLQYAPGENVNDRLMGLSAGYSAGPFALGASHEWNKDRLNGNRTNKVSTLGANWDFGALKLYGGYQRGQDLTANTGNVGAFSNLAVTSSSATFTATKLDVYTFAASVPFGSVLLGANYTLTKFEPATGSASADVGKFAVGVRYGLSKNTFLYTALSSATGDLKDDISQKRVFQAGLRTAF
jgi:general bacterial porin, GBP family